MATSSGNQFGDEIPEPTNPGGLDVEIEWLGGYLKWGKGSQGHIVFSDEPPTMEGGRNLGARPLDYFALGMGF